MAECLIPEGREVLSGEIMKNGGLAGIDANQCQPCESEPWLWSRPDCPLVATLILAHGAGAPMDSEFMNAMAERLAARGIAVLRFEFPYMAARRQDGRRRPPNPQAKLLDCWREVYALVRPQADGPLAIGGKSMGGRMASLLADELQADALVCLGYPFHPAGRKDNPRVAHLSDIKTPTLIIQGERDALGSRDTVSGYRLSSSVQVHWLAAADHDLKPLKVTGVSHAQHLDSAADVVAKWLIAAVAPA